MTDKQIIRQIQDGDIYSSEKALKYIYTSCYNMVEKMIVTNSGTKEDAKDVFQDSMIVLYNCIKRPEFLLESKLTTFLFSISRNLWLKKLRSQKRINEIKDDIDLNPTVISNIQDVLEFDERQIMLAKLLKESGEKCLKLLNAFYYEKHKLKKICQLLEYSSIQVVKNQKSRCLKKIKILLSKDLMYQEFINK